MWVTGVATDHSKAVRGKPSFWDSGGKGSAGFWEGACGNGHPLCSESGHPLPVCKRGFPMAQPVKNLPAMQEAGSLGREDPLEEGVATHSSILAWRFLWTEEPGGLQSIGLQRVRHD